jgi:hypothetical protein
MRGPAAPINRNAFVTGKDDTAAQSADGLEQAI